MNALDFLELLQDPKLHTFLGFLAFGVTIHGVHQQTKLTLSQKTTSGILKREVIKRLVASTIITISVGIKWHPLFYGSLAMTLVMLRYSYAVWKYRHQ